MAQSLDGASVVVLGGTSGIGLATARMVQEAGAQVIVVGRDESRAAAAVDELGGGARAATLDIADERAVKALFESLGHVDHVAMLAGTHVAGEIADLDTEAMQGPVASRFWGAVHVCKYAPATMTDGSITICTGAGVGRPRRGGAIVAASAGGSEMLARTAALELAPIRVNIIRPGLVDTPLLDRMAGEHRDAMIAAQSKRIPLGRIAQAEEIAHAIVFLMSNTYVTGSTLTIDGGFSLT